jgi:hypothetical protein
MKLGTPDVVAADHASGRRSPEPSAPQGGTYSLSFRGTAGSELRGELADSHKVRTTLKETER